nr:type II toxin-antitoxin system HicA family toxin [Neorhizobium galegae]
MPKSPCDPAFPGGVLARRNDHNRLCANSAGWQFLSFLPFNEVVHIYARREGRRTETNTAKIRRRLEKDGWYLDRHGAGHDIYRHPKIESIITVPRHTQVSPMVARSIARKAGWPD